MVKFSDNKCLKCGGIRAAESPLCVDCLIALVNTYAPAQDIANARIKKLEEEKSKLSGLVERLLEHISSEAVYMSGLRLELWKTKKIINGG